MVTDMKKLRDLTSAGLPYFLLGHSMGSFLTRAYCALYGDTLAGAIFSGTGDAPPILPFARLLTRLAVRFGGPEREGRIFYKLSGQAYNNKFKPNRTGSDWLTRDKDKIDSFLSDSRSQFTFTNSGYRDLFSMLAFISEKNWAGSLPGKLPVLLISGGEDPLGEGGKGVLRVFKRLTAAGCQDVTLKLYGQGRHEMLNEVNRAEVYTDVLNWMLSRTR
jgi:alpha-beta hydrolase superfamily lysophospholipase